MKNPKLLLLGWDAADWQLIDQFLEEGKMPNLARFLKRGVRGNIATLQPVLSPMLWTSIATGKRAYDHGIHGFVEADHSSGEIAPVGSHSRNCKAFWNILNQAGLKTNIINWWPSHPAEKLKGISVSNHFYQNYPKPDEDWPATAKAVYPESWTERLSELRILPAELTAAHLKPFIPELKPGEFTKDKVLQAITKILAKTASVHAAATEVMANSDWDLTAVYFDAIDHLSHLAMKYHPPKIEGVTEDEFQRYRYIVEAGYRFHDMMLGRYLELAGKNCHIMIVSDHGFESGRMRVAQLPDVPAAPALEHRPYGIFAAAGPSFKSAQNVFGSSLLDVTPSILHLFDLPVAQDMEGQIMPDLFKVERKAGVIPSWEDGEKPWQNTGHRHFDEGEIKQLEALGYIDLPENDKLKYVEFERNYNLAVSLVDGGKLDQAIELCDQCFEKSGERRFAEIWMNSLLKQGEFGKLAALLDRVEKKYPRDYATYFFRGMLHLSNGREEEALTLFLKLEDKGARSPQLFNRIAEGFLIKGNLKAAQSYFEKVLKLDQDNAGALTGLAQVNLEKGKPELSQSFLDQSLSLRFFQPRAHYLMAQAAVTLNEMDLAQQALKLCLKQAPKHQGAKNMYRQHFLPPQKNVAKEVIIVSGLPRSGTSLMMQILNEAGLQVLSDQVRPEDEYNPKGYWEYEAVKKLGQDSSWLKDHPGKVIKVVSPLLRYLPSDLNYKIIFMDRPLLEVLVSQEVMKGRERTAVMQNFPFQMAADFENEHQRLFNWLDLQPNINYRMVKFYDCLQNPDQVAKILSEFLERPILENHIKNAADAKLHHNKLGK